MGLERAVDKVFEELGQPCSSTAYLVGLLQPGGDRHPLCVEPEDGTLAPVDFDAVEARAQEIYGEDPESSMYHSHPRVHKRRHRRARERAMGRAINEVIERHAGGAVTCFAGLPTPVEQHLVYPIVAIPADNVEQWPTLTRDSGDEPRWKVDRSIAHAALAEVLGQATRALHLPDAGEGAEIGVDPPEIVRAAVERLTRSVVVLSGNDLAGPLSDAMNRLCTMRYERRVGVGRLLLAQVETPGLEVDLRFRGPIPMGETRTLRKLLELSGQKGPGLLTDGDSVYGLGRLGAAYDPSTERAFELLVLGDGTWELRHLNTGLATIRHGSARLPEPPLGHDRFVEIVRRVFNDAPGNDPGALWDLVVASSEAEHGTMIVVSASAADEAERLSSQALPVDAVLLPSELLHKVTQIDGAVLVDPHGACHALGVILDGPAGKAGDRSRGARYNSAIKYLDSAPSPTVIVIVSEDGMVNLLPDLHPQVRRQAIASALEDLRAAAAIEPVRPERFYKAFGRVKNLSFYLSDEQCAEVNQLHTEHWDRRRAEGATIWRTPEQLSPDPRMDDSYLID